MRLAGGASHSRCTDFVALRRRLLLGLLAAALVLVPGLKDPDSASAAGGLPITVDDTRDMPDANPGDGECKAGWTDGGCQRPAAGAQANATARHDTVTPEPGV